MKSSLLLAAGLFLLGNGVVLMMYRGIVRSSHLFVTAGTVLSPMVICDFILGAICLAIFVLDIIRGRKTR
jgi:hypothetical protein